MGDSIDVQDQVHQEAAEETLSLGRRPLTTDAPDGNSQRRSTSEPTDFFEFFSDLNAKNMCHAEDIIYCGKLVPFKEPFHPKHEIRKPPTREEKKLQSFHRRRSESLSDINITQTRTHDSTERNPMKSNQSLDYYLKLRRNSSVRSQSSEINLNSSVRSSRKSEIWGIKILKPSWPAFMFGHVKFPPEMDLQDIKNRQVRRHPGTMFSSFENGKKVSVSRSDRKSTWGLLTVLSCKDHASVAVTTSFGCMPQV